MPIRGDLANPIPSSDRSLPEGDRPGDLRAALISLIGAALVGIALALVFPDAHQQDAGNHFLFARFASSDPSRFVGVWNRPLFTTLYFVPAQFGYLAAKSFTLLIALLTAWHTFALCRSLRMARAPLVIALLFLEPSFLLLATETMTEPLFALLFVIALRLDFASRPRLAMLVVSLLVMVRPEGAILAAVWGVKSIFDARLSPKLAPRLANGALLGSGLALWWIAAYAITGDPLFLKHDWPREWSVTEQTYGTGPVATYLLRLPEIAGPLLAVFFVRGLLRSARHAELRLVASSFLALFLVHTLLRTTGSLGSAGYARYFVCVAPAIAILTLLGLAGIERRSVLAPLFVVSGVCALYYLDYANFEGRDVFAIRAMKRWLDEHPQPAARMVWSHAYMGILFDREPTETPPFTGDRDANLDLVRQLPTGTLVLWDACLGPDRFHLQVEDFESAGFAAIHAEHHRLTGWTRADLWLKAARLREQTMFVLTKLPTDAGGLRSAPR